MKKIYCFSLILAVAAFFMPHKAYALFPSFDSTVVGFEAKNLKDFIKQVDEAVEQTKNAVNISNSIGSAGKTFSELTIDKAKDAADAAEKMKKEAEKIKKLRDEVKKREEELKAKRDLIDNAVSQANEYRNSVGIGSSSDFGSSSNPYDVPDDTYYDNSDYVDNEASYGQEQNYEEEQPVNNNDYSNDTPIYNNDRQQPNREGFTRPEETPLPVTNIPQEEIPLPVKDENLDEEEEIVDSEEEELKGEEEEEEDTSSAVENYDLPYLDNSEVPSETSSNASVGNTKTNQRIDKAKDVINKGSKGRRQPFKRTSLYINYDTIGFAAEASSADAKVYSGAYGDMQIIPKSLAYKCEASVESLKDPTNMQNCIGVRLLSDMSQENATAAAEAQKDYIVITRDMAVLILANSMKLAAEAAQYEDEVLKPTAESVTSAGNTRDDISSGSLVQLKGGATITNKLIWGMANKTIYDSFRQLGYFSFNDYENHLLAEKNKKETEEPKV